MKSSRPRIDRVARKHRFQALSDIGEFCDVLFPHEKTRKACILFLGWLKQHQHGVSKKEMSQFGRDLQDGKAHACFQYRRDSLYGTILRRLVDLGFIELITRVDDVSYYVATRQRIPKRPPGGRNFYNLAYYICHAWNRFFK